MIRNTTHQDDFEKYLDIYEVNPADMQEAFTGYTENEFEDMESLKALRILQYRIDTLRRAFLCSLLALEADGGRPDFSRWRRATNAMSHVAVVMGDWAAKNGNILQEEEEFNLSTPQKEPTTPARERLRTQLRHLTSLSQGIRGLQARMQILREESNRTLDETEDVNDLGRRLMSQYDSVGVDLRNLMQAWETGKASLAHNIERNSRRVSQASSGLLSPVPSLGGRTAVEDGGSPSDALKALNGEGLTHLRTPSTSVSGGSGSDEEVFEAIAIPKRRNTITREERIAKIHEERARQISLRERRETNTSMIRELESVMKLKPKQRMSTGRITPG